MTFDNIEYLKNGNERQRAAYRTLTENSVFERLQVFSPLLTGSIPINIDIDESDLDIVCYWEKKDAFANTLRREFGQVHGFNLREQVINDYETVLASFHLNEFEIEIFGQNIPTRQQNAYRHMIVEYKLLCERDEAFRQKIIDLKKQGYKTEPSFAIALELSGNPYLELLRYENI